MSSPVEKFRDGNLSVSIFENQGINCGFHSAKIQLRYKDKDDHEWKDGVKYGLRDVHRAIKLLSDAEKWMEAHKPAKAPAPKTTDEPRF
jgi:hypothetical protein